jgi:hypothetical protein
VVKTTIKRNGLGDAGAGVKDLGLGRLHRIGCGSAPFEFLDSGPSPQSGEHILNLVVIGPHVRSQSHPDEIVMKIRIAHQAFVQKAGEVKRALLIVAIENKCQKVMLAGAHVHAGGTGVSGPVQPKTTQDDNAIFNTVGEQLNFNLSHKNFQLFIRFKKTIYLNLLLHYIYHIYLYASIMKV